MSRTSPALVERTKTSGYALEIVRLDALRPTEALVRIEASGICATDLHYTAEFYPAIKGHEGCAIIEELGDQLKAEGKFSVGERVILTWNRCGECRQCTTGRPNYCVDLMKLCFSGKRQDGSILAFDSEGKEMSCGWFGQSSFSKWTIANGTTLTKLPDYASTLPVDLLAVFTCGIITGSGSVANVLKPDERRSIAICGTGNVGLSGLMMAAYMGAKRIVAIDRDEERLELALTLGATHTVLTESDDEQIIKESIRKVAGDDLACVLDTTGFAPLVRGAFLALDACGTLCSVATGGNPPIAMRQADIYTAGKTWTGTHQGNSDPHTFIPHLIKLHLEGKFPVDKLVKVYSPEQMSEAVEDMKSGKTIKGVIKW